MLRCRQFDEQINNVLFQFFIQVNVVQCFCTAILLIFRLVSFLSQNIFAFQSYLVEKYQEYICFFILSKRLNFINWQFFTWKSVLNKRPPHKRYKKRDEHSSYPKLRGNPDGVVFGSRYLILNISILFFKAALIALLFFCKTYLSECLSMIFDVQSSNFYGHYIQ